MLELAYDYQKCVQNSEKVSWKLDDVMPPGTRLDFSLPFLPEGLCSMESLDFLSSHEKIKLNQLTGNAYLNLFHFVEEYIIAVALEHAQAEMFSGNTDSMRALIRFADEELKHQQLFARYKEAFDRDFGFVPKVLEGAAQVAGIIMSKSPVAVIAVTLHLELITQQHYTESVKGDNNIDPFFTTLLKHHWLEEAQHAKIDALELDKMVSFADQEQLDQLFEDYIFIINAFDGLLSAQAAMDVDSLEEVISRSFVEAEKNKIIASQLKAYRNDFILYGLNNSMFMEIMQKISETGFRKLLDLKEDFIMRK